MSDEVKDYQAYTALDPAARMQARLQGLSEVLNASGLKVLSEDMVSEPAANTPHALATGQQAFNEAPAFFGRPVAPGEGGPVQMRDAAGQYVLAAQDLDVFAKRLGVPRDAIIAALRDMPKHR
jgi:hypothetical protein